MPTRSSFAVALSLASLAAAVACTGTMARAEDLGAKAQTMAQARDLVPAPVTPGASVGQRPVVTLRPSAPAVRVGAPISFEVGSSVNGYGHIYVLSASGRVQVWMENAPIAAGQRLVFPTGDIAILAAAPAGREDLMLIVTKERIDGFIGRGATRSPRVLDLDHQSFKQALSAKFIDLPHRQWGYARTSVQVVDRAASGTGWGWGTDFRSDAAPSGGLWSGQWEMD
jgi:hypothetical protein